MRYAVNILATKRGIGLSIFQLFALFAFGACAVDGENSAADQQELVAGPVGQFIANVSVPGARVGFSVNPQSLPKYQLKAQNQDVPLSVILVAKQDVFGIELNRPRPDGTMEVTEVRPPPGAQIELRGAGCARGIEAAKFSEADFNIRIEGFFDSVAAATPGVAPFKASCVMD